QDESVETTTTGQTPIQETVSEQSSWSAQMEAETSESEKVTVPVVDPVPKLEVRTEEQPKKSCVEFERSEVRGWETKTLNSLTNSDLLKVLMTRGEDTQNPALVVGSRHL